MKKLSSGVVKASVGLALLATISHAQAVPVGTELLLLADVSGSLDAADFALQRDGYVAAFQNPGVHNLIASTSGGIAVSLVYWSSTQNQVVSWTHITDAASSNAFASSIAAASRPSSGSTYMTDALTFGTGLFASNGFEGDRLVIDVSGDGSETGKCSYTDPSCVPLQNARDAAFSAGIDTINALWIEDEAQPSTRDFFCLDVSCDINPVNYGNTNVIGGSDSFQTVVSSFAGFEDAIVAKIKRELAPPALPEPTTLALMGLGLAGLGYRRKRLAA